VAPRLPQARARQGGRHEHAEQEPPDDLPTVVIDAGEGRLVLEGLLLALLLDLSLIMSQRPMSTAVADIRHNAEQRLKELEPYLEEAEQLRRVIELLDAPVALPAATPRVRPGTLRSATTPVSVDARRAPQGANKRRILALVLERPGITAAEIARSTGLKRTVVASTMSRLKRTGELEPHGKGARVPADREAETLALLAA
jgi:hypothetical protein